MIKLHKTEGNQNISLLESAIRTANVTVEIENPLNRGGAFIINVADAGTLQSETATVVATITLDGDIDVIVTSAILVGSPLTTTVAVLAGDDENDVAGKIRTALQGVSAITDDYTVSGVDDKVILTAIEEAANDATLNIDVHFTPQVGTVDDNTSADTIAGELTETLQIETATVVGTCTTSGALTVIVTGALVAGSPLSMQVDILASDTPTQQADKIKTVMNVSAITDNYTIGGSGANIVLTTIAAAANDATLNIDYHITTDIGVTDEASSADTEAGAVQYQVETAVCVGTITGEGNLEVIVTGALVTGSPLTLAPILVLVDDTPTIVAAKVRTALNIPAIEDNYTVSGSAANVILTANDYAANDATLNISIANDTSTGFVDDLTSTDTTAGIATAQIETATVNATITEDGFIDTVFTSGIAVGSPISTSVAVANGDSASDVAGKIRTALGLISAITDDYTVGGTGADVVVTAIVPAADDATLNLATSWTASVGTVDDTTSTNTQAGELTETQQVETATVIGNVTTSGQLTVIVTGALVTGSPLSLQVLTEASDTQDEVATLIRAAMSVAAITDEYAISGATNAVILTADDAADDDATLNIDYHITTTIGLTDDNTSEDTTGGTATISVTPKIQGKDNINGVYYDILTGATITAAGTAVLKVYPGITPSANVAVSDILPRYMRLVMTHGDTVNATYSVVLNSNIIRLFIVTSALLVVTEASPQSPETKQV